MERPVSPQEIKTIWDAIEYLQKKIDELFELTKQLRND
jgi:hypothetical protein